MIIEKEQADADFKLQFAECITENEIRTPELLKLLKSRKDYTALGEAFRLVADGEIEKSFIAARRGYQAATGSDEAALFALSDLLTLLPRDNISQPVQFTKLPPKLLHRRVSLFGHLSDLVPGKLSLSMLATLEVEANCLSDMSVLRIGQYGANRISDLLHGTSDEQTLGLDLLDRLGEYAKELTEEIIIVTSRQKPVAALVSLKNVDAETIALSTNAKFHEIIEASKKQVRSGKTRTLHQMKREFGKKTPLRSGHRTLSQSTPDKNSESRMGALKSDSSFRKPNENPQIRF